MEAKLRFATSIWGLLDAGRTGQKREGFWHSLSGVQAVIETAHDFPITTVRIPVISISSTTPSQHLSNLQAVQTIDIIVAKISKTTIDITTLTLVKSKVLGLLHKFASAIYYERLFSGMAESVFERYKASVDALLAGRCTEILTKCPAVYDRLAEGNQEAIGRVNC